MGERRFPVFVYGTLLPGEKNYSRYLEGRTEAELPAAIDGQLYFWEKEGYPYVEPGEGRVEGVVMHLAPGFYEDTLRALDILEEYDPRDEVGSVYKRRRAQAFLRDGNAVTVWVYYWNRPERAGRRIASGDFRDRFR